MASTIPPILIQLQADVTQLKKGLADAESAIKGVDSNVKKASTGMTNFVGTLKKVGAAMGATFAAAQVANFAKQSVMAASNMEESLSKVRVVFGEGAAEVEAFGASAAQNLGISNQAALEAAGTYGNLFQAFGLGQGEAQQMSTSLVQLAADMASFNNTSIDQAITALRSGLSGETEPLKRFGVALSEVRLKEEALRMGLITTTKGTLPVAIKSQAAYSLILRDTALAQGDYARTADGTANTMKTLQAKMEDAKVAVGQALMPAFRALLKLLDLIIPVLTTLGEFFKKNMDYIKALAIGVGVATAAFVTYRAIMITVTTASKLFAVAQVLMSGGQLAAIASTNTLAASILRLNAVMRANPIGLVVTAVALLVAGFVLLWKKSDTFRKAVITVAKVALTAFASIVPMVGKVYEAIMKVVSGPLRSMLTVLSKLPGVGKYAKAGLDIMNKGLEGISDFADSASAKAKDLAAKLDKMGAAAQKNGEKVKKATKGVTTTTTTVDTEAAKKAADEAKKRAEQVAEAQMSYMEAQIKAHQDYQEKVADLQKDYAKSLADAEEEAAKNRAEAQSTYDQAYADAKKQEVKALVDIAKDYAKKTADIEEAHQKKLTDLRASAAKKAVDLRKSAADKEVSIIKQSVDRLRSAFASGTGFSLTEAFKGKTAGGLLAQMKQQLDDAKKLQEAAAYLAGQGYAQTFIEQVVKAGPEVGLQMVDELKKASPEQQAEIRNTFMDLEGIQETGLDALAKSMNNGANLATDELRQAYDQVAIDLKNSLAEVDRELQESLAVQNAEYAMAMAEAKIERDARMLEAATQLQEAITAAKTNLDKALAEAESTLAKAREEAQKRLNEGLAEAQRVLQKALIDAQLAYQKAIDDISATTAAKLKALQAQLAAVAAATVALQAANAAFTSAASTSKVTPVTTTTTKPVTTTPTPTTNIVTNITGVNLTNPGSTASSVVSAIKYGNAVTVNTTTLAGIEAASAAKSTTMTSAQIIANRRAMYGEI
jgi:hypothetical protein